MKRAFTVKNFFLLSSRLEPARPPWQRVLWRLWPLFWVVLSSLGLGLISLLMAIGPYPAELAQGYWETPLLLYLNLGPVVALALLFFGLFRSARRSFLLTALLTLGFSAGHYYKLFFRDDPLMMADLFLLKEAGNMMGNYSLFWNDFLF